MAIVPRTEPILQAASTWMERCLLSDGSVLVPDRNLWTLAHLDELNEHYVEKPKLGSEQFVEKLEEQLRSASLGAGRAPVGDDALPLEFLAGHEAREGACGMRGAAGVSSPDGAVRAGEDPWALEEWLWRSRDLGQCQLPHSLTHLLHPEHFESSSAASPKQKILEGFGREEAARGEPVEMDRALLELRRALEAEYPDRPSLSFYRPPLIERWQHVQVAEFELIGESMTRAKEIFLEAMPGFRTFVDSGDAYEGSFPRA